MHEGASGDLYERGLAFPLATYLRVLCSVSVPSCFKYIPQTTVAPSLFHPSLVPERNGHMNISTVRIDLIKAARGLTNVDLAADCGISRQSISAILRRGTCTPIIAGKLARGLGVSLWYQMAAVPAGHCYRPGAVPGDGEGIF